MSDTGGSRRITRSAPLARALPRPRRVPGPDKGPLLPPQPAPGKTMQSDVFDFQMMYHAGEANPYGFGYVLYHVPSAGAAPRLVKSNQLGHYKPSSTHAYSVHTVKDTSSVSKSISGFSMMKLISLVPDVSQAHHTMVTTGSAAATTAWRALVDHYYNLPITALLPSPPSGGTDWENIRSSAADGHHHPAANIRISDLLGHRSGLAFKSNGKPILDSHGNGIDGDDYSSIERCLNDWTKAAYEEAQTTTALQYANANFAMMRYVIAAFYARHVHSPASTATHIGNNATLSASYVSLTQQHLFPSSVLSSTPDCSPWGSERSWFASIGPNRTFVDWMNTQSSWPIVSGAQGWKMSVHQLGYFMASITSGRIFPIEYWQYLLDQIATLPAGYTAGMGVSNGFYTGIPLYGHNGGDGDGHAESSTWWLAFDDYVLAMMCNSDVASFFTNGDFVWEWFFIADLSLFTSYG